MKNSNGRSVKVRDLPEDKQRSFAIVAEQVGLTAEQERVLRMQHGVGAPPEQELEFRGQNHPRTRRLLAKMEKKTLCVTRQHLHPGLN